VSATLTKLLARTRYLLLDFDGPVCAIFAGRPARTVVHELLDIVSAAGAPTPEPLTRTGDPFDVLRYAATVSPSLAGRVEDALRAAEIDAVGAAAPTPQATSVVRIWRNAGRAVAIVSNNATAAVESYLASRAIDVDLVVARTSCDPTLLKPNPYLVVKAIELLRAPPGSCVMLGDSMSDILAAREAGVPTIGYANKPGKLCALSDAGAAVVIDQMQTLADAAASAFA
jgi:phosphoglycolate phosphatase